MIGLAALPLLLCSGCRQEQRTQAVRKDITDAVFASGHLVAENEYQLTARAEGYLEQSFVREGDLVRKDMLLFRLSDHIPSAQLANANNTYTDARHKADARSPQILQLQSQIAQAQMQADTDRANYQRYAQLVKTGAVAQAEYEKAKLQLALSEENIQILKKSLADLQSSLALNKETSHNNLRIQQESYRDYTLHSAIDGQVFEVFKQPGELVKKGEPLAKLGGGRLLARLYISEEDILRVVPGQKVLLSLNTHPQQLHTATISRIFPAFDPQEQSFTAEAAFEQVPAKLFAGTQLQANIVVAQRQRALVIPTAFLTADGQVRLPNGELVSVQTGIRTAEWTEITAGLDTSQTIIIPNTL